MCQAIALGADRDWIDESTEFSSPIHQSILSGSVMACKFLLLNGAKINAIGKVLHITLGSLLAV